MKKGRLQGRIKAPFNRRDFYGFFTRICFQNLQEADDVITWDFEVVQLEGGGLGGSKNCKTATKCAKNRETVSKIVENRNRNVCVVF